MKGRFYRLDPHGLRFSGQIGTCGTKSIDRLRSIPVSIPLGCVRHREGAFVTGMLSPATSGRLSTLALVCLLHRRI